MRTIYKYPLWQLDFQYAPLTDVFTIDMHKGWNVLCMEMQNFVICLWAEVAIDASLVPVQFRLVGTEQPLFTTEQYVGSVFGGMHVWHVYQC